jgi:hypothetical protein
MIAFGGRIRGFSGKGKGMGRGRGLRLCKISNVVCMHPEIE